MYDNPVRKKKKRKRNDNKDFTTDQVVRFRCFE